MLPHPGIYSPIMDVDARIADLVARHAGRAVTADDQLLEAGLLDSFALVALSMDLQDAFAIELPGDAITADNFGDLARIGALVRRLLP